MLTHFEIEAIRTTAATHRNRTLSMILLNLLTLPTDRLCDHVVRTDRQAARSPHLLKAMSLPIDRLLRTEPDVRIRPRRAAAHRTPLGLSGRQGGGATMSRTCTWTEMSSEC